jgi:peptidoglycan/xylan/chitin deacetylase (PgdA/CDA1 family)
MRLDRLIILNLVQPFRRAWFKVQSSAPAINSQLSTLNSKWPVPILMYHSISDDPEPSVSPYYQVNTRPAVFRQQMQFLAAQGYSTISLDQLVSMLTTGLQDDRITGLQDHGAKMPRGPISAFSFQLSAFPKLVCLTFDDGFADFYTQAFPVLQNHGFIATMFLPTAFIGDERRQFRPSTINSPPSAVLLQRTGQPSTMKDCLIWSEVRELRRHGIHFGSHTVNHPKLVELDWPAIKSELSDSKSSIEQRLGEPVTAFCYPFAFPQTDRDFIHRFTDVLSDTGYRSCATTELGRVRPGTAPFRLKRLPANSLDDLALFAAKLDGAYDWLAAPQSAVKTMKAFLGPRSPAKNPVAPTGGTSNPARMLNSAEQ